MRTRFQEWFTRRFSCRWAEIHRRRIDRKFIGRKTISRLNIIAPIAVFYGLLFNLVYLFQVEVLTACLRRLQLDKVSLLQEPRPHRQSTQMDRVHPRRRNNTNRLAIQPRRVSVIFSVRSRCSKRIFIISSSCDLDSDMNLARGYSGGRRPPLPLWRNASCDWFSHDEPPLEGISRFYSLIVVVFVVFCWLLTECLIDSLSSFSSHLKVW